VRGRFLVVVRSSWAASLRATVRDLALAYDEMPGPVTKKAACTTRPAENVTPCWRRTSAFGMAIAGGYQEDTFPRGRRGPVARVATGVAPRESSKYPKPRAPAPRPMSIIHDRRRSNCILIACDSGPQPRTISIRRVREPVAGGRDDPGAMRRTRRKNSAAGTRQGRECQLRRCDHARHTPCTAPKLGRRRSADGRRASGAGPISASTPSRFP